MAEPELHLGPDGRPLSDVGQGVGLRFAKEYFGEAKHTLRIASGYLQLAGYEMSRRYINEAARILILVNTEDGKNVEEVLAHLVQEVLRQLGQAVDPLYETVIEIIRRIDENLFVIRGAWATEDSPRFHCKFYIMDDTCMWSGSANYSKRGLGPAGNYEQVRFSREAEEVKKHTIFFDKALLNSHDLLKALYNCLKAWLKMATPFEAYLKVLDYWYKRDEFRLGRGGKVPTYYQEGVIARAVYQVQKHGGTLLLIATGLGKTVIGAETTRQVTSNYLDKKIILLAPKSVHALWRDQMRSRGLDCEYFDNNLLFRKESEVRHHQITQLLDWLEQCDEFTILVIDEAHLYRKLLRKDVTIKRHNASEEEKLINLVKERISEAAEKGAKIILLTATPYGTDIQDVNSLLCLLPAPRSPLTWSVKDLDELAQLEPVTILGVIHLLKMACDRRDLDEDQRIFIRMPEAKQYLPRKIILYREGYSLFLEEEIQDAFAKMLFKATLMPFDVYIDTDNQFKLKAADTKRNIALDAWLSSSAAFKHVVSLCSGAADRTHYKANFTVKLEDRQETLIPLLEKLNQIDPETEDKFARLRRIIVLHTQQRHKVVLFVNRLLTAVHLSDTLKRTEPDIRVGCTVQGTDRPALKAPEIRKDIIEHFSPRSHNRSAENIAEEKEFDVLICTDADGIGINMQDACVAVNYDMASGADELFQRAGRILRLTGDPDRVVHLYSFEPMLADDTTKLAQDIKRKIDQLHKRHNDSRAVTNARTAVVGSIFPDIENWDGPFEIPLAYPEDIKSLPQDIVLPEERIQSEPHSVLSHISTWTRHKEKASNLPDVMLSARTTQGKEKLVFVLIRHDSKYDIVLYDITNKVLKRTTIEEALELIQCTETEPKGPVSPQIVEQEGIEAVKAWCQSKQIDPETCEHPCIIYLKPAGDQEQDIKDVLSKVPEDGKGKAG